MYHNRLILMSIALLAPLTALADTQESSPIAMTRQRLMERPLDPPASPGVVRVIRVHFPPGYKTPLHTHDAQGPRYITQGKLRVVDHGETTLYGSGDTFWETGAEMTIENVGGSDAEMIIFEVASPHS